MFFEIYTDGSYVGMDVLSDSPEDALSEAKDVARDLPG